MAELGTHLAYRKGRPETLCLKLCAPYFYPTQSGLLDPSPIITHRLPLEEFDKAMDLIAHGECGKVLLLP